MKHRHASILAAGALLGVLTISGSPSSAQTPPKPATARPARPAAPATQKPIEPAAPAKPAPDSPERNADRQAVLAAAKEFVAAFDQGDAKTIAAQWTAEGEFRSDVAAPLVGREAIEKSYADFFKAHPKSKAEIEVLGVRFVAPNAAIEDGILWVSADGPTLPTSTRYSVLHVKEGEKWLAASGREWGGAAEKLSDLAWLVGDWKATAKDHSAEMSYSWNDAKTLLKCEFTRREGDKVVGRGTQWINNDPQTGRLRSWSTDEDGGRGEAVWFRDGETWVSEARGVSAGGASTAAYNLISRVGPNAIIWKSIRRVVNGEPTADTDPIKLERAKAAK